MNHSCNLHKNIVDFGLFLPFFYFCNHNRSYTSYLAPTTSMRLHAEAQAHSYHPSNPIEGPYGKPCGNLAAMEMSYVVRTHAASQTHKELSCWTFSHPIRKGNMSLSKAVEGVNNKRHIELNFTDSLSSAVGYRSGYRLKCDTLESIVDSIHENCKTSYTLHGFLGTFHCLLYQSFTHKAVTISIAPNTFSTGMYSWFPLYFPLKEPLIIPPNSTIRCNIWRQCDTSSVWYEWCAEVIDNSSCKVISASCLHNPRGRSSKILL
jgi:protein arginine N-methyltransferase 5